MARRAYTRRRPRRGAARRSRYGRRSVAKRRSPSRYRRSSKMGRKRVLNLTSVKKRDTMAPAERTGAPGDPWIPTQSNIVPDVTTPGNVVRFHFWPATARTSVTTIATDSPSKRQQSTCFLVGIKEETHFEVQTGTPWEHRQIIFSAKGLGELDWVNDYVAFNQNFGYLRGQNEMSQTNQAVLADILFAGVQGVDFVGYMNAPVDRNRFTIHRDRTRQIRGGNDSGQLKRYSDWLPLRKNLNYDDTEQGSEIIPSRWSRLGKAGMGDVFFLDLFRSLTTADPNDLLSWRSNATLYWHER
uniref:Capsid protein n=1 Tax=Genomoviridae sp. TaxID=2202565 RepID=A0A858NE20_9VIRU|nr:MAG: capsid protein [Genomoviridae sp.]